MDSITQGERPASVRGTVMRVITNVAQANGKTIPPLTDDLELLDSGLDSLCLAVIVASLEDELGVDPFRTSADGAIPGTVGELVALYEGATT